MKRERLSTIAVTVVAVGALLGSGTLAGAGVSEASSSHRALASSAPAAEGIPSPEEFFGFAMGTKGKLAAYPDVLEYMRLIADESDRVSYETVGETTMGNEYASVILSSPENLDRLDEIVEMNERLSDPRSTTPEQAERLAAESVPVYYLEATVHSSEVGNGQAINDIAYRLATETSEFTETVLDNSVIMLVPSQNPDGQHLVVDHFNRTAGTDLARTYPDLYHKYTGHDDNRDWLMFTQVESRLRLGLIKKYNPAMVHIMHQQGNSGERIFVPPYGGITSENVPANSNASSAAVGQHAARALAADGKRGVGTLDYPIYWTIEQPVGYFPFTGAGVYLTEIASVEDYAYPQKSEDGGPIGPQQARQSFIQPYEKSTWTLADIVDYAETATYAGMEYVAQNHEKLLYDNVYAVPREYTRNGVGSGSYAFVIPADQRDPYATFELLERMEMTQVEIDRATAPFNAGGRSYKAGSYVIKLHQPLGNWAHQVLGVDDYPEGEDLPYAEATTSMPLLLGVDADEVADPFDAELERVADVTVPDVTMPEAPGRRGSYLVRPSSYGTIPIVSALQRDRIRTFRAAERFRRGGSSYPAGTYVIPATPQARAVLAEASETVGLRVTAANRAPRVGGVQLKPRTRVGLFRGIGNMPGGWDMWLFDQYGINYDVVGAQDFQHKSLNDLYDTIVLSSGISREDIVEGLDKDEYGARYSWAYGVGNRGWRKLRRFVRGGGTLLAIGSSVGTVKELMHLRGMREALPEDSEEFATGGSMLNQEFDTGDPVAWGMPESWPVWLYNTQAWRATGDRANVVSSYPSDGKILASGFLRGAEHIRGAANVLTFERGKGTVVTYGSEVTFRSLPRVTFPMVFNAIYWGPAAAVSRTELTQLEPQFRSRSSH